MTQGLVHDSKYIDHVYEVIRLEGSGRSMKEAKKKWKAVLLSLHKKTHGGDQRPAQLTPDEEKAFKLFQDINEPNKFLNAAHRKRLRVQSGEKEMFLDGIKQSGRYLPLMERIFAANKMPVELTRLPFVESSFNVRARSKVGASGVWQFIRSTGKSFLKINDAVDERNDPVRATEAAAKLLRLNFESLGNWPLAVTAYNHGRIGMMKAVRKIGSEDLEDLVRDFHSRHFGFASSNYFTELLAAIEVEKNAEKYFGKVLLEKPVNYYEIKIPDYISVQELSKFMKIDLDSMQELNPGLQNSVFEGDRLIPAGYYLRLPYNGSLPRDATERVFLAGYSQIPSLYKLKSQKRTRLSRRSMIGLHRAGT